MCRLTAPVFPLPSAVHRTCYTDPTSSPSAAAGADVQRQVNDGLRANVTSRSPNLSPIRFRRAARSILIPGITADGALRRNRRAEVFFAGRAYATLSSSTLQRVIIIFSRPLLTRRRLTSKRRRRCDVATATTPAARLDHQASLMRLKRVSPCR